jgi:enamine deaminase RidA (YjgF/YER057c/UK114 family)
MSYQAKLREMGYELQAIELDAGRLMLAVRTGNLVYTSGATSTWGDQKVIGKVGQDVTVKEAYEGAKMSALNCLQAAHTLVGSIDNIVRVVKVLGMVNVAPAFNDTPNVINGASDLFIEVFGDAGRHARSAVGMQIPFDFAVEVEAIFEVR